MAYFFLREDFLALEDKIAEVEEKVRECGREMALSCQEGAETFHDNFAFEEGERQQRMWSREYGRLVELHRNARLVDPPTDNTVVALGKTVTMRDLETDKSVSYQIGSFLVFSSVLGRISYESPLARMIIGRRVGDECTALIAGKKRSFEIEKIL